jgi:hypothetical protein
VNWWQLRAVGNLYVLKISYVVLVAIPLLSKHRELAQALGFAPWLMATLFTASFALGLANLVYDIRCPTIVKRFESPNDLYEKMLEVRARAVQLYPHDNFDASLSHCKAAYSSASSSQPLSRWLCSCLFVTSGSAFAVVFGYRACVVFGALTS